MTASQLFSQTHQLPYSIPIYISDHAYNSCPKPSIKNEKEKGIFFLSDFERGGGAIAPSCPYVAPPLDV